MGGEEPHLWKTLEGLYTVFDPIFEHQFSAVLARLPPWGNAASGRFATKLGELLVGLVQDGVLLFKTHCNRVLVRVAMKTSTSRGAISNCFCISQTTSK